MTEASTGLKPAVEKAFFEGYEAGQRRIPASDNPYLANALFDPDQLAAAWFKGRKGAIDYRIQNAHKRRHAWNRA